MKPAGGLIKGAGSDTGGAIRAVGRPETKAGLGIDRPPEQAFPVGYIMGLYRRFSRHDRFAGTFFGTLLTSHAKVPNPEFDRFIRNEG